MVSNKPAMIKKLGSEEAYLKHMRELASKAGKISRGGGFTGDPERARLAGLKGHESRRKKAEQK